MTGVDIVGTEVVYDGYSTIRLVTARLSDGREIKREVESHGQVVVVLPYDPIRKTAMLVRQLRLAVKLTLGDDNFLEAPAGMVDRGERGDDAVRREALEEVGLKLGMLQPIGVVWPSPGVSDEQMTLYLAVYGTQDRIAPGGGLETEQEDILVCETPLSSLKSLGSNGAAVDLKLLTLVQALQLRRPDLFN